MAVQVSGCREGGPYGMSGNGGKIHFTAFRLSPFALTHNLHEALRGSGDRRRSSPRGGEKRSSIEHPRLRDRSRYGARHSGVMP